MRKFVLLLSCGFIVFMGAAWVDGQPGGGKGGKGGFGGFQQTPVSLLNRTDVKEELKLTDAQLEELPAEYLKAIEKVLKPGQFKRFKQIELQTRGNNAFKDKSVRTALKFTDEQIKSINGLLEGSDKEIADLAPKGGGGKKKGGDFKGAFEKIQNVQKETKEKILTALTKEQRKQWREMIGEEFKMQQGGFGFGGGFGGKKKGADKKDN
jgi:hypothetical protein